jgi:hypothetical protein
VLDMTYKNLLEFWEGNHSFRKLIGTACIAAVGWILVNQELFVALFPEDYKAFMLPFWFVVLSVLTNWLKHNTKVEDVPVLGVLVAKKKK